MKFSRTEAALKLLALGPLSRGDFVAITGWAPDQARRTLGLLAETGRAEYATIDNRRVIRLTEDEHMKCQACSSDESLVLSTHRAKAKISRRRKCSACGHQWVTHEISEAELTAMKNAADAIRLVGAVVKELSHG